MTSLAVVRLLPSVRLQRLSRCKVVNAPCYTDNQPNSFNSLHDGRLLEASLAKAKADRQRKVLEFDQKQSSGNRSHQNRISSWADPVSARDIMDGEEDEAGAKRTKEVKPSKLAEGSIMEEVVEDDDDELEPVRDWSDKDREVPRSILTYDVQRWGLFSSIPRTAFLSPTPCRRRSFHDLSSLRGMHVLNIEQMTVDVELCGQLLIMARREEHLQNVIACLQVLFFRCTQFLFMS